VAYCCYLFVFVWKYVDTRLLYHGDTVVLSPTWWITFPWFHKGWAYFQDYAVQPGGVAEYLGAWLAQYFYYPATGALVYVLLGAAIYVGTVVLGRAAQIRGAWGAAYLSLLAVLCIASSYSFPLASLVGIASALLAVSLHALTVKLQFPRLLRDLVFLVLVVVVFWASSAACVIFAIGSGLIEWRTGHRRWVGVVYLLIASLVVLAGTYVYLHRRSDMGFLFTWQRLVDHAGRWAIPVTVYSGQIAVMLLWSWFSGFMARRAPSTQGAAGATPRDQLFRDTVAVALLGAAAALTSFGLLDIETQQALRVNYLARTSQWSEMLGEITAAPPAAYPPALLYDINRALYETGQLSESMFAFPQQPQYLIQFGRDAVPYRGCQELLMALGLVNEAEQTACEALEVRGARPSILRDLIVINLAKDRPEAARVFLNLLRRDVIHGQWAKATLQRLDESPRMEADREVSRLRQCMLREDHILLAGQDLFDALLEQNPRNRMAFEYRMAYWLLTRQLDQVAQQRPSLHELGYDKIPRHYAEALLIHWQVSGQQPDLGSYRIDSDLVTRFRTFVKVSSSGTSNPAAMSQLVGGTYLQYFFSSSAMAP
jgi:hypothetical protein